MEMLFITISLIAAFASTTALPRLDFGNNRTQRIAHCTDGLEYKHSDICCLLCPAGTHVKLHCTKPHNKGVCEECDYGATFIEHMNGFTECWKCTTCRSDQEIVRKCSSTQDTECQCRLGKFCSPDQPCEVCKKCSRCEKDEEVVRNCTATTNTKCKKIQQKSDISSDSSAMIIAALLLSAGFIVVVVCALCWWKRRHSKPDSTIEIKPGLKEEELPDVIPVNGVESLKKCFEFFEEMEVDYHRRFFRNLGISDNVIKSRDHLLYEDRVHELLNIWVEKEGKEASLNSLLSVMLLLNQRQTAETIMEKALQHGHFKKECF